MKKNLTELVFILDRSGSMPSELQQETLKRLPEKMRAAYELFRQNPERRM